MDSEYDRKFEEMKKYIPFLENMITRLESTSTSSSNPRQAQLDKIRSLRDLLLNKKKRMKMENLLKCEQVLVNLYAKVEQRDTSIKKITDSGFSIDAPTSKEKSDLEAVRNKLKNVVQRQENTLPEILPLNEGKDVHTGSKEPALFQRRPSNHSKEVEETKTSPQSTKRNYTRVLVSPDSSSRRWSPSKSSSEKPLFSRRSPRKSPRRYSPSYHKKERKKSKESQSRKRKDLNITLNVPESSLNSLNTKDILSRIINCSDSDVDIATLRELRKQIRNELKKTGTKDDISDLILKSYKDNKKTDVKKNDEIEEGELSDSESEAIESIYGSLIIKDQNVPGQIKLTSDKEDLPRKIQICFVINSEEEKEKANVMPKSNTTDIIELEMYEKNSEDKISAGKEKNKSEVETVEDVDDKTNKCDESDKSSTTNKQDKHEIVLIESDEISSSSSKDSVNNTSQDSVKNIANEEVSVSSKENVATPTTTADNLTSTKEHVIAASKEPTQFKANFYKPLIEPTNSESAESVNKTGSCSSTLKSENNTKTANLVGNLSNIENTLKRMEDSPEIPLLNEPTIEKKPPENALSEIDILQALKNEILSDISMPGSETATPLLHQPKVMKVASAQEILPKKRISIEKYKEKKVPSKIPLDQTLLKEDHSKKTSLKLTAKECERFSISKDVPKISFDEEDESLDDDDDITASDVYDDLAPKSPDHDEASNTELAPPVIIPVDPVKTMPVTFKADVDMRTLPLLSPNNTKMSTLRDVGTISNSDLSANKNNADNKVDPNRPPLIDPRVKRDVNPNFSSSSPNPHAVSSEKTPRNNLFIGKSANSTPNPIMTPNARTYDMTPTHQSFEIDQPNRSHVYVPGLDFRKKEESVTKESRSWDNTELVGERRSRIDDVREPSWNSSQRDVPQKTRFSDSFNADNYKGGLRHDRYGLDNRPVDSPPLTSFGISEPRHEAPMTPIHPFGRSDCPSTPSHPFGRSDCPPTPSHPFGRLECPPTPSHPFGRLECPATPSHPFGRTDCPPTPSHPFGRLDCPPTPSHSFGRSDRPGTPSHSFGRSDRPATPSHSFGRGDGPPPLMFNVVDCPPNPSHLFGVSECPPTPTPLFGRNEGPIPNLTFSPSDCTPKVQPPFGFHDTPPSANNSFGRVEPLKNQYSRSDFNPQNYTKDPRLNRKPESELKPQYDERDRSYYKDRDRYRGSSYSSQKSYSGSDSYRHYDREQGTGRNSKYKYYSPDLGGRYKDQHRRERSVGRSMPRDHNDELHGRERRYIDEGRSYEEVGSRRERDKSIGRNNESENTRSSSRSISVGRSNPRESERNKVSVKSDAGRSFHIDSSVSMTFQKYIDRANEMQECLNSFDARRQRAASVGRSLTRESSVGRTLIEVAKSKNVTYENKREAFRRASSVGRDVIEAKADKRSFQEIKADFRSFTCSSKQFDNNKSSEPTERSNRGSENNEKEKIDNIMKEKSRQVSSKSSYSPRKNYRDPRMRKQLENKTDRRSSDSRGRKSGIVYSNDNIVTGSILTSGYGVKNYKIPKIKRATEEKEIVEKTDTIVSKDEKDSKNSSTKKGLEKNNDKEQQQDKGLKKDNEVNKEIKKDSKEVNKEIKKDNEVNKEINKDNEVNKEIKKTKETNKNIPKEKDVKSSVTTPKQNKDDKSDEIIERRQTRSSKKGLLDSKTATGSPVKTRKYKKVIYESDSDTEIDTQSQNSQESVNLNSKVESSDPEADKKSLDTVDMGSSFGMDELDVFPENIASDPVLDNINALIADLDTDLGTAKTDFTKEISLENMMESISSPERESQLDDARILEAIDQIAKDNEDNASLLEKMPETVENVESLSGSLAADSVPDKVSPENILLDINDESKDNKDFKDSVGNVPTQSDAINKEELTARSEDKSPTPSTKLSNEDIDSTTEIEKDLKPSEEKQKMDELNMDTCSTPDSTINTDDALQKSTNEESIPGSTNEVTSTESIELKQNPSAKETAPALESFGSLLSILQDKSKIKELLNMLGDQSNENDKIKKKLEKLSEIVSDDEETCDVPNNKNEQAEENITELSVTTEKEDKKISDETEIGPTKDDELSKDGSFLNENDSKLGDDDTKTSDTDIQQDLQDTQEIGSEIQNEVYKVKKKPAKKSKKAKGKAKKITSIAEKRVTRATAAETKPKVKKPPRELMQLQEDIKEMFIRDDVLSATGIRMCRLAKLVDEKVPSKEEPVLLDTGPVVVLEKYKDTNDKHSETEKVKKKKIGPKTRVKTSSESVPETSKTDKSQVAAKIKPGPKSKTKNKKESDPYSFEDSVDDSHTEKASDDGSSNCSDSENDSIASSQSFGSTEPLSDVKKKTKRKRRGWQAGIIKPKNKKKKIEQKHPEHPAPEALDDSLPEKSPVPDFNCFTDRNYCFKKNQLTYSCRLCVFTGTDIVLHYRNKHPHVEIPLSRMTPDVAKEAIEQCEEVNFKAISKIPSDKYICTFCFKEFANTKCVLETFFWHIVSMHTGEYKQNCSQCVNANECPFNLDIPPPPKNVKGQLIGFICKKCNFTQISLENLKTHVIVRHNDEQTAVYTINLSLMTKKVLSSLLRRSESEQTALEQEANVINPKNTDKDTEFERIKTRTSSKKTNQSIAPPLKSMITFEGDDNVSEVSDLVSEISEANVKLEKIDSENPEEFPSTDVSDIDRPCDLDEQVPVAQPRPSNDIVDYPHFKINLAESGAKQYLCCINGNHHFKTTLLISMKKHVQKHSEHWDGYCSICKVIVTPQGVHKFRDCLQHYLDKHMDEFPVLEKETEPEQEAEQQPSTSQIAPPTASKPLINVRPLSDLVPKAVDAVFQESSGFPVIQSVMSLGNPTAEASQPSSIYPTPGEKSQVEAKIVQYEEFQAKVLSNKYHLVHQSMLIAENLIKIFKCAGRYCSYTTDSVEEALKHATSHQRVGGADTLNCCYCDFDSAGNAIDLVMHVFKCHGSCVYCCEKCFYRATSSQSVGSHITRVHGGLPAPGSVLRTTKISPIPSEKHTILTRDKVVPYYVCGHSDADGQCKFRTYIPDKFSEHLQQRHQPPHPCHLCSEEWANAPELLQHMKTHGLKLYQCTWCTHGADNESELLAHVSSLHPDKHPQAYIRIITNKDGSEKRVLPLAFLNKYQVPPKDVTPTQNKEDPMREAERSIELEHLIGHIHKTVTEPSTAPAEEPLETSADIAEIPSELDTLAQTEIPLETTQASTITPVTPPQQSDPEIVKETKPVIVPTESNSQTSITMPMGIPLRIPPDTQITLVKKEPVEPNKDLPTGDIVVLDSDDEETSAKEPSQVIDLSEDEPSASTEPTGSELVNLTTRIVPVDRLHRCPECLQVCRTMRGLKKHMNTCVTDKFDVTCPHCPHRGVNLEAMMIHYMSDHSDSSKFECGICQAIFSAEYITKKHIRTTHKDMLITSNTKVGSRIVVNATKRPPVEAPKVPPKRKMSASKTDALPTKRRFEPQEVDMLPINPILDHLVYCNRCEFSTKVRLNMVRHLQLHAEQQPVPQTAPVNPVPHLESNEKHFDKMVNLASSSIVNRTPEKVRSDVPAMVNLLIPPEAASRYPKFVPERQRHTCGAKGCSYISVDEAMLRCHWETLHSGTSDFHCVHCPPHQHLDTSKPLTATRILSHLKMHDSTLYACSSCSYYHFKREALEKHLSEIHKTGRLMVVREEYTAPILPAPVQTVAAPTMDLKPWQCGLCKFKSMLRPEVVDHCSKMHQSKMQFKCVYCPFRTSAIENISKHQTNSHAGKPEEVFYYYYREGSIPDEADGTPRWVYQRQKTGSTEPEVKVEISASPERRTSSPDPDAPLTIDLNLVKLEVEEPASAQSIEELCLRFGKFCEPNGIKYKCPLCTVVMEDTKEAMQSHLYEELNYRKWSCGLCAYKAFHKAGLTEHMSIEHCKQYDHIELPTDINIEKWVVAVLDHQTQTINKYKENLAKQKIIVENKPGPSNEVVVPKETVGKHTDQELIAAFGSFGAPNDKMFCCPKCGFLSTEKVSMSDHLEMELNKIRWYCSACAVNFQTYHEAQFHCKGHDKPSRPVEAIRDPSMRTAWLGACIQSQLKLMENVFTSSSSEPPTPEKSLPDTDNSLFVVRYEERVPNPDQINVTRKRSAPDTNAVESLTIHEPVPKKKDDKFCCPYCPFKSFHAKSVKTHMLMHFNLKPFTCGYCKFGSYQKQAILKHIQEMHSFKPPQVIVTQLPPHAMKPTKAYMSELKCLECEEDVPEAELDTHLHENVKPELTNTEVVVKCSVCSKLAIDIKSLRDHHKSAHPDVPVTYTRYKLGSGSRTYTCFYCNLKCKSLKYYKAHHAAVHVTLPFKITPLASVSNDISDSPIPVKRCARKSTTKLPNSVAKKSTTKLPYYVPSSLGEGYSYYGTAPPPLAQYTNVTTLMPFCNMMMPFSLKQLSEHLNIEPKVLVTDIKKSSE